MTTKTAKKEIHWRYKKCLPAEALAKEGGDENAFYACPVVSGVYPVDSIAVLRGCTTGVRLIGNETDREEIRKERKQ